MSRFAQLSIASVAVLLATAACGGGAATSPPTTSPAEAPAEPVVEAPPADMAFKDMNDDQRKAFMKTVVLPRMKEVFVAFDAAEFGDMDCTTCHGEDAKAGKFEMPNAKLPALPGTQDGWDKLMADPDDARWLKFMAETVKPEMAKLLKMSEFDPATGVGDFSCHNCHTEEGGGGH